MGPGPAGPPRPPTDPAVRGLLDRLPRRLARAPAQAELVDRFFNHPFIQTLRLQADLGDTWLSRRLDGLWSRLRGSATALVGRPGADPPPAPDPAVVSLPTGARPMPDDPKPRPAATVSFGDVLRAELDAVVDRRAAVFGEAVRPAPDDAPADPRGRSLDLATVGLAFSGGGIRSATFNLGFLQGLARLKLLPAFDYLSTVSGGGYIGSWLAAWVRRESADEPRPGEPGTKIGNVQRQLDPSRAVNAGAVRTVAVPDVPRPHDHFRAERLTQTTDNEPEPVSHLRAYRRYLAPDASPLGIDRWVLAAISLRNTLVNLTLLVAAAAAVVLAGRAVVWVYGRPVVAGGDAAPLRWDWVLTGLFLAFGTAASFLTVRSHVLLHEKQKGRWLRPTSLAWTWVAAAGLAAWLFSPAGRIPLRTLIYEDPIVRLRHAGFETVNMLLTGTDEVGRLGIVRTLVVYFGGFGLGFVLVGAAVLAVEAVRARVRPGSGVVVPWRPALRHLFKMFSFGASSASA